jgi:PKD repeat protein
MAILLLIFTVTLASSLLAVHPPIAHATTQNVSVVSISPTRTCCGTPNHPYTLGQIFYVSVNASVIAGQYFQGFDVRVNYTSPNVVLQATGINYSSNVFASHQNSGPVVECIDGISQISNAAGCSGEIIGQVHFAESVLGPALNGPVSGTLFTVSFQVVGLGSSVFTFDRADLTNPNPDPANPQFTHFTFIPVLESAGVFGNVGVVAFFNYQPVDPTISVSVLNGPTNPVNFDAGSSFAANDSAMGFKLFSWSFGDGGGTVNNSNPVQQHIFSVSGNYTVSLMVTDNKNQVAFLTRRVSVLPALGGLDLTVEDQSGNLQRGNVLVLLFNSSSSPLFANKTVNGAGEAVFARLAPGSYYLTFSGQGIVGTSVFEKVVPGWTTRDTVYVALVAQNAPPNYGGLIYAGTILGAVGVVGVAFVYQKRKASRAVKKKGRGGLSGKNRISPRSGRSNRLP